MKLIVNEDGFCIEARGMRIHLDNENICFTGSSTADLTLPVDDTVGLLDNMNLAYKLLIRARTEGIQFKAQPSLRKQK